MGPAPNRDCIILEVSENEQNALSTPTDFTQTKKLHFDAAHS
jgi:hypothetical protein